MKYILGFEIGFGTVWRKVFPLSNNLNTQLELGALTMG